MAELCRDIEVTRRKLPKIPELEHEIVTLQSQLEEVSTTIRTARQQQREHARDMTQQERMLAERLSAELEAPENSKRWRKLEGKDPEPEDLAAKLQVLEELHE